MQLHIKPCKWCKEEEPKHWPYQCRDNPKIRVKVGGSVRKRVTVAEREWLKVRRQWFKDNPPNEEGFYICYLCKIWLYPIDTTLDHVIPRSNDESLKYEMSNLESCCNPCNIKKGSQSLENYLANA